MSKTTTFRLIIEDNENIIEWPSDVDKSVIRQLVVFVNDQLRMKYSTDTFTYRDAENEHYQLNDIVEYEISPLYLTIPSRKDIQTFNKDFDRKSRNVYSFKDPNTVIKYRYENSELFEQTEISVTEIKETNYKNQNERFEDPILSAGKNSMSITFQKPEVEEDGPPSPTFGGAANTDQNGFLKPAQLVTDPSKRMVKPSAGGDGKSQSAFLKIAEMNKYPLGKPIELKGYTIEEVKKHNRSTDAWMVLNGKIYDVTKYIPYHPGKNKILMGVGKDGTNLYNEYHPWVNAHVLLEKYHIGFLKK